MLDTAPAIRPHGLGHALARKLYHNYADKRKEMRSYRISFLLFEEANREDCSKIPKARKTHKFSTFGKSLSIRTFAGHRHKPPYLLLYLKMKIIHEIGQAAFSYN